jgi:hypothetical protein
MNIYSYYLHLFLCLISFFFQKRDDRFSEPGSSVSIVSGYRLDDRAIEVRFPAESKYFFLYPLCPDQL